MVLEALVEQVEQEMQLVQVEQVVEPWEANQDVIPMLAVANSVEDAKPRAANSVQPSGFPRASHVRPRAPRA